MCSRRNNTILALAISSLMLLGACEEMTEVVPEQAEVPGTAKEAAAAADIEKYVILTGEHHATLSFENVALDQLKFNALFDSTAIYSTIDPANQADINKLYGMADCNSYHHTNSARFGWRWHEEQLEIWAYTYVNGERNSAFVDTVSLGVFNEYEISFEDNNYRFRLNEKEVEMPRQCEATAEGYKLFPYFGGDETAPHDISIWIEELKN
ncbi:hypothetical protein [Nafulsella turpanensis]|uniref:hypothetical protein n=1 Tax=Nafulsella turpanensis TaxID=1265690 RepID=UPI001268BA66|nr:hypothetical protein [Nafulsella turpanensis]